VLSDIDSDVINRYGVLNTLVQPDDVPFYGVPFPGFFLLDEDGVIVDKLFNRHFANREGVEAILDSFLGRVEPGLSEPVEMVTEDDGIRVTAFLRGGGGVLRIGPRRRLIVRLEMPDGLHTYGEPVPDGMVATQIDIEGPDGFCCEAIESPPTRPLQLPGVSAPLHVWDGTVDFVIPTYANTALARAIRNGQESITVRIHLRYQACDNTQCFMPRTRTIELDVPVANGVMPRFDQMKDYDGTAIEMDSMAHMRRLLERKLGRNPDQE